MEKKNKLSLKKLTILSIDDAHLIRGGETNETADAAANESYCGNCRTQGGPDECPPTDPPNSCMVCDTQNTCTCI